MARTRAEHHQAGAELRICPAKPAATASSPATRSAYTLAPILPVARLPRGTQARRPCRSPSSAARCVSFAVLAFAARSVLTWSNLGLPDPARTPSRPLRLAFPLFRRKPRVATWPALSCRGLPRAQPRLQQSGRRESGALVRSPTAALPVAGARILPRSSPRSGSACPGLPSLPDGSALGRRMRRGAGDLRT